MLKTIFFIDCSTVYHSFTHHGRLPYDFPTLFTKLCSSQFYQSALTIIYYCSTISMVKIYGILKYMLIGFCRQPVTALLWWPLLKPSFLNIFSYYLHQWLISWCLWMNDFEGRSSRGLSAGQMQAEMMHNLCVCVCLTCGGVSRTDSRIKDRKQTGIETLSASVHKHTHCLLVISTLNLCITKYK